jgi:hypothetical protein
MAATEGATATAAAAEAAAVCVLSAIVGQQ